MRQTVGHLPDAKNPPEPLGTAPVPTSAHRQVYAKLHQTLEIHPTKPAISSLAPARDLMC